MEDGKTGEESGGVKRKKKGEGKKGEEKRGKERRGPSQLKILATPLHHYQYSTNAIESIPFYHSQLSKHNTFN